MNKIFRKKFDAIALVLWKLFVLNGCIVAIDRAACFFADKERSWLSYGYSAMVCLALLILPRFIDNLVPRNINK